MARRMGANSLSAGGETSKSTGNPTVILARRLQRGTQREFAQAVVVDNRPGAGGLLGGNKNVGVFWRGECVWDDRESKPVPPLNLNDLEPFLTKRTG